MKASKHRESKIPSAARAYLAEIGKRGGTAKSDAKVIAVRANGKLGGRPSEGKSARRKAISAYIRDHGGLRGLSPEEKQEILRAAERIIDNLI